MGTLGPSFWLPEPRSGSDRTTSFSADIGGQAAHTLVAEQIVLSGAEVVVVTGYDHLLSEKALDGFTASLRSQPELAKWHGLLDCRRCNGGWPARPRRFHCTRRHALLDVRPAESISSSPLT